MYKNFTQDFNQLKAHAYLLIEEASSGQFVVFASKEDIEEYGEHDAARTLSIELDDDETVALQLTKLLTSEGFSLNSFREVARETHVSYSFVDDEPGTVRDTLALHVRVDIADRELLKRGEMLLVSLDNYAQLMTNVLFGDRLIDIGVSTLLSEQLSR